MRIRGIMYALCFSALTACGSGVDLPSDFPLPEGGERFTTDDQHDLYSPVFGFEYNKRFKYLWTEIPSLLREAGWTVIAEDPPRHIGAEKDGTKVAIEIKPNLSEPGISEVLIQVGNTELGHLNLACTQLETCCYTIKESVEVEEGSKLAENIKYACKPSSMTKNTLCRTMLSTMRSDMRGLDIDSSEIQACYTIPLHIDVTSRIGK